MTLITITGSSEVPSEFDWTLCPICSPCSFLSGPPRAVFDLKGVINSLPGDTVLALNTIPSKYPTNVPGLDERDKYPEKPLPPAEAYFRDLLISRWISYISNGRSTDSTDYKSAKTTFNRDTSRLGRGGIRSYHLRNPAYEMLLTLRGWKKSAKLWGAAMRGETSTSPSISSGSALEYEFEISRTKEEILFDLLENSVKVQTFFKSMENEDQWPVATLRSHYYAAVKSINKVLRDWRRSVGTGS